MRLLWFFPIFLWLSQANAAALSGEKWKTLRTENFHVHYTEEQSAFANAFVNYLERALPKLKIDMDWDPKTPIDVVVKDQSDSANGLAVSFPNTHLEIYPVPFEVDSSLADYTNWVELLAIHELTHLVANDTTTGAYKFLRSIFGSVVKPNGLQPPWLVEGLAVYEETRLTRSGRGRAPLTEAILRAYVNEGFIQGTQYLALDRLNDGPFWWPGGHSAYLVGYALQASVAGDSKAKSSFPGRFSKRNSSRFPYTPNYVVEDLEGYDWLTAWDKFREKIAARYAQKNKAPPRCNLTKSGRFTGIPALSPDGFLYFSMDHQNHGSVLARVKPDAACDGSGVEILVKKESLGTPSNISISKDGRYVLYTDSNIEGSGRYVFDIYVYDVEKKSSTRITHDQRAFDPAFVSGSHSFVFVRNRGDNTQTLERLDWQPGENITATTELFRSKAFERLSDPVVFANGVFFAKHNNAGQEEILRLDLESKNVGAIISDQNRPGKGTLFFERQPQVDAKTGKLFFSANYDPFGKENTFSLYLWQNGAPVKIYSSPSGYTRSLTNLADGSIVVNDYDSSGFNLYRDQRAIHQVNPQKNDLHHYLSKNDVDQIAAQGKPISKAEEYRAAKSPATSLWPQYWLPIFTSALDGSLLGAQTSGNDAIDSHSYNISAMWDSRASFPTYNIAYLNQVMPWELRVSVSQHNDYSQSFKRSNRQARYALDASYPYGHWRVGVGSAFDERSYLGSRSETGQIFQYTLFRNTNAAPAAMAPTRGIDTALFLAAHPASRFEASFGEVRGDFEGFIRGLHPSHSVLFGAHGGFTSNRLLASNYFQGGGPSPLSSSSYIVHGYPIDALLGQRIATVQTAYTLPLAKIYRGWNTNPIFVKGAGLRASADAGTASFLGEYDDRGVNFRGYQGQKFGHRWIHGAALDFLLTGSVFHHVPFEMVLGLHRGFKAQYGGTNIFYLGLNFGNPGLP